MGRARLRHVLLGQGRLHLTVPGRCGRGSIRGAAQLRAIGGVAEAHRAVTEMATRRTRSLSRNVPFVLP